MPFKRPSGSASIFTQSSIQHILLSTYHVPGTILGAGNAATNNSGLRSLPAQSLTGDREKQTGHDY